MNYLADFLIAHPVPDSAIRSAFAAALALDTRDVGVWRRGQVLDRTTTAIVQTSAVLGDFAYQLSVTVDVDLTKLDQRAKLLDIARTLARELSTIVVTDDVGVDAAFDDDFLLVAPDGATEIVQADLDAMENDAIVLVPESRSRYEAIRSANRPVIVSR